MWISGVFMARESCLEHRKRERMVILRESYISLCADDHCSAALLGLFEYLTNGELERIEKAEESGEPWIRVSMNRICSDMMEHYSRRSIQERMGWFRSWNLISIDESDAGEIRRYLLNIDVVNDLLERRVRLLEPPAKLLDQNSPTPAKPDCGFAHGMDAKTSQNVPALSLKEEVESKRVGSIDTQPRTRLTPSTTLDTGELDPETGEEFPRQQPYKKNWKRPKAEKPHAKSDRLRELREAGSAGASVMAPTDHPRSDTPLPHPPMEPAAPQRDCIAIWNESFPALAVNPSLYQNGNFPYALRDGSMLANMPDVVVKVRWLVDNGSDVTFSHLIRKEASGVFGWSAILSGSLDWTTKKRQNPKEKLNDFLESEMKELEKRRAAKHS